MAASRTDGRIENECIWMSMHLPAAAVARVARRHGPLQHATATCEAARGIAAILRGR